MNQHLIGLINTSFISDAEKERFVARLQSSEDEQLVAEDFNASLLAEFEQLKQDRDRAVAAFDAAAAMLDVEHIAARNKLSADTNRALDKLRSTDFVARRQLWDDFDVAVEAQEKSHQDHLRQLLSRSLRSTS